MALCGQDHAVGDGMEERQRCFQDGRDMDAAKLGNEHEQEETRPDTSEIG